MRVEWVTPSHHPSLVELLREVHAYYHDGASVSQALVSAYLTDCLLAPTSPLELLVATREPSQVVGLAAISLTWSLVDPSVETRRQCWLKELFVRSSERGAGVGRALMVGVAKYATSQGCARVDWPVKADNARGIAFYERLGARRVADRLSYRLAGPALRKLAGERT